MLVEENGAAVEGVEVEGIEVPGMGAGSTFKSSIWLKLQS